MDRRNLLAVTLLILRCETENDPFVSRNLYSLLEFRSFIIKVPL